MITEATLLVRSLPESASCVSSPSRRPDGRCCGPADDPGGWRPSIVRVYDPDATEANLKRILDIDIVGVQAIVGFDGPAALVDVEDAAVRVGSRHIRGHGGRPRDRRLLVGEPLQIFFPPFRPELPSIGEPRTSSRRTTGSFRHTTPFGRSSSRRFRTTTCGSEATFPLVRIPGCHGVWALHRPKPARRR